VTPPGTHVGGSIPVKLRPLVLGVATALAALAVAGPTGGSAARHVSFASASSATVHPGVQTRTRGAQCTANFVYTDGSDTYIGQAAHCSGTGSATSTDGCTSASLPEGTPVVIGGAAHPGVMVYNSWVRMQSRHERDPNTCAFNDLALVRIDPADVASVNPSVPVLGGPKAVGTGPLAMLSTVYTYGNSSLRQGITLLSPKRGFSVGDQGGGWSHGTFTLTPGIPGDSGSGLMDGAGNARGVLSTIEFTPLTGSNNFGDLSLELAYANSIGFKVALVPGDVAFRAPLLPPIG